MAMASIYNKFSGLMSKKTSKARVEFPVSYPVFPIGQELTASAKSLRVDIICISYCSHSL